MEAAGGGVDARVQRVGGDDVGGVRAGGVSSGGVVRERVSTSGSEGSRRGLRRAIGSWRLVSSLTGKTTGGTHS